MASALQGVKYCSASDIPAPLDSHTSMKWTRCVNVGYSSLCDQEDACTCGNEDMLTVSDCLLNQSWNIQHQFCLTLESESEPEG